MKKKSVFILALFLINACQKNDFSKENETKISETTTYDLVGKDALLTYQEFKAEVKYVSDSSLHWKVTQNGEGKVLEGDESAYIKRIDGSHFFVNWIEKDGLTVSQVIDMKENTVTSFATFHDEKSTRGKRGQMKLEGTFQLIK